MAGALDPEKVERQRARSDMVRAALLRAGDDGRVPRHVAHYLYPATSVAADDDAMRVALLPYGDKVGYSADGSGLVLEQRRAVAPGAFDAEVAALQTLADRLGWDYDGWECAVAGMDKEG